MSNEQNTISIKTIVNNLDVPVSMSELPVQMIGDRVLILPKDPDKYLSELAKIERPVNMQEEFKTGTVKSIGGGEYGYEIPSHLKVNLVVNYYHQGKKDVEIDGLTYHLVRACDIIMYL